MKIKEISFTNEGYINCKSEFYSALDTLRSTKYFFSTGINKMVGEIDSCNWAASYYMSMFKKNNNDFILFNEPEIIVNNKIYSLNDFKKFSCYMDRTYYRPFSSQIPLSVLVTAQLKKNNLDTTSKDIQELFEISSGRFSRPLNQMGNEGIRGMAALGYSMKKQVFCFPWLSKKRFDYYSNNLLLCLDVLNRLNTIVILPVGE